MNELIRVTLNEANEGRKVHQDSLRNQAGRFTAYFDAIDQASPNNLKKLSQTYPGHAFAHEEKVKPDRIGMEIMENKRLDDLKCELENVIALMDKAEEPKEKDRLKKRLYEIAREAGEICFQRKTGT
ncbi:MAG: hypothetical protein K6T65_15525 [Peptococcaceae bacterium]|nr:hypothetical protein [Peptococcaceae bacterium]